MSVLTYYSSAVWNYFLHWCRGFFLKKTVIINIFRGYGIYIYLNVLVFLDFHTQSFRRTNRDLYFLWNVNLTKEIRPRTRKVYPLGNKWPLFFMWGMKLISRFRTQWKCRWMRSPLIYQNAKTNHFRHTELHTSPGLVFTAPTRNQLVLVQRTSTDVDVGVTPYRH